MTIFSIADLHLDNGEKPMDVFGPHWTEHFVRIQADWRARVQEDDVVLLPGDLSWAMRLEDAGEHMEMIGALPGRKLLIKGNHDYWWGSISRVRALLTSGTYALQNDCMELDGVLFAGTRGWTIPGVDTDAADIRIYERELLRLEMTLSAARRRSESLPLICMMHYPPLTHNHKDTAFAKLLTQYGVRHLFYGHLHGAAIAHAFHGMHDGVDYHLVSCDSLDFKLFELPEHWNDIPCAGIDLPVVQV